jgi:hypothetical protein
VVVRAAPPTIRFAGQLATVRGPIGPTSATRACGRLTLTADDIDISRSPSLTIAAPFSGTSINKLYVRYQADGLPEHDAQGNMCFDTTHGPDAQIRVFYGNAQIELTTSVDPQ